MVGIVSHADYADYLFDKNLWDVVVMRDIATENVKTVTPGDTLEKALREITAKDYATLPVLAGPQ